MRNLKLSRWVAVLALAIALAQGAASAQEADTLSISGTFHMDAVREDQGGTVGADLAAVFANGNEHWWRLTLYGVTYSYEEIYDFESDEDHYITRVHATSFDFEFFGPDADVLNEVVSQQLTRSSLGEDVFLELQNVYSYGGLYPGDATWGLGLLPLEDSAGVSFFAGAWYKYLTGVWFPTDENGYPLVEPQRVTSQEISIHDFRPGSSGALMSFGDLVDIGSSGPPLRPMLSIEDASALEGDPGAGRLVKMTVKLPGTSPDNVTVNYQTTNGTALAKNDYYATSGTLRFGPGQTQATIVIAIKGDRKREPDETFSVRLSGAVGAIIADGVATATILNDD